MVAPELARLEQERERIRYGREEAMIVSLREAKRLRPGLSYRAARDSLWSRTGSDGDLRLVRERGWSSRKYQDWLADTLVQSLLIQS